MVSIEIDNEIETIPEFTALSPREKFLKIKLIYDILENAWNKDQLLSVDQMVEESLEEKTDEYQEMIRDPQNELKYERTNTDTTIQREIDFKVKLKEQENIFLTSRLNEKEKVIQEKDDLLRHWGIVNMNSSGNVAKGDLGEKILETFLKQNLSPIMKAECKVQLVSKGKGHTGDLLIEIPALKKRILIESKYKDSEKVRTKEINRSIDDLISSEYDPDIILSVSFKTGFTGLEDRQIKMINDTSKIKIFSVFEDFEEHFKSGNGIMLCDWILSLVKVHDNMKESDISKLKCIENKIDIFRQTNKTMNQCHLTMIKELKRAIDLDNNISSYINEMIHIINSGQGGEVVEIIEDPIIEIVKENEYNNKMNKIDLKKACKEHKISISGTKEELVQRLNNKS